MILPDCCLEWDTARGVLYVHNKKTGTTVLRISQLPKKNIKSDQFFIDLTHMFGVHIEQLTNFDKEVGDD